MQIACWVGSSFSLVACPAGYDTLHLSKSTWPQICQSRLV
jgi:hypothetical protein